MFSKRRTMVLATLCAMAFVASIAVSSASGQVKVPDKKKNAGDKVEKDKGKKTMTLAEMVAKNADLKTFIQAAKAAGMVKTFKKKGPFTVLAPTNNAFASLKKGKLEKLLKPKNRKELRALLSHHIVQGLFMAKDFKKEKATFKTLDGTTITATLDDNGDIRIGNAKIVSADIVAANGVIHLISDVLKVAKPKN